MAHNTRIRANTAAWANGSAVTQAEYDTLDQRQFESINGDQGGVCAPAAEIEIGGSGLKTSGPMTATGTMTARGLTALAGIVSQFTPQAQNFPLRVTDSADGFKDAAHGLASSLWLACGANVSSPRLLTSPDGRTWTSQTVGAAANNLEAIAANGSIAVVSELNGANVYTSTDGASWTARALAGGYPRALHWFAGANLFVAGQTAGALATSPDGGVTAWVARTTPAGFAAKTWKRFASKSSGGNLCVGIVSGSHDKCVTSPDGITWTERTLAEAIDAKGICYSTGQQRFYIVGASGKVQHSADGITWTAANVSSPVTFDAQDVAAHGHLVVVTHKVSNGRFRTYYTVDGATWKRGAELDGAAFATARLVYAAERNQFIFAGNTAVHFSLSAGDDTA